MSPRMPRNSKTRPGTQGSKIAKRNVMPRTIKLACLFLAVSWFCSTAVFAAGLFEGREIYLSNPANKAIRMGVTGTTSGHNFIALLANTRQESISLGELGYWEKVPDPPSFLRNFDLQLNVKNQSAGNFRLELAYDPAGKDILLKVLEGQVKVSLDKSHYYPTLVIEDTAPVVTAAPVKTPSPAALNRVLFFDFNSFDADLRKHYGKVKKLLNNARFKTYFYYYESTDYNTYYFRTYQDTARLDTEKMGLSLENGTLVYYQKVLDNLKSLHGNDIAGEIILVTRYGKKYSRALKKYARDIGVSDGTSVVIWSYEDVQ